MSSDSGATVAFRDLETRDVVLLRLTQHSPQGFEQEGMRPAVVVGDPARLGTPRFPVLVVAPFTTDRRAGWSRENPYLYPRLAAGSGNLSVDSICLIDQIRTIDLSRVVTRWGRLSAREFEPIQNGLMHILGAGTAD